MPPTGAPARRLHYLPTCSIRTPDEQVSARVTHQCCKPTIQHGIDRPRARQTFCHRPPHSSLFQQRLSRHYPFPFYFSVADTDYFLFHYSVISSSLCRTGFTRATPVFMVRVADSSKVDYRPSPPTTNILRHHHITSLTPHDVAAPSPPRCADG